MLLLFITLAVVCQDASLSDKKPAERYFEVMLTDQSRIKVKLVDEQVEFTTKYGKLLIPSSEIERIEFGLRISEEVERQIQMAVSDLGHNDFKKRDEAAAMLIRFGEKSVPSVRRALQSADPEVVKRAEEVMAKLDATLPKERMNVPDYDVIHTAQSKIAGLVVAPVFKVRSEALGELSLKLTDAASVALFGNESNFTGMALADPGNMTEYQGQVGKSLVFKVTGTVQGNVWGTGFYTLDSTLGAAAVHAGFVKPGQVGYVRVTLMGPTANFQGTQQHGVTSSPYQNYPGAYRLSKAK